MTTPTETKRKHTETSVSEMEARLIVIETGLPYLNADIAKLGGKRRYGLGDGDEVSILEDYRFRLCQERNRLKAAITQARGR